MKRNLWWSRVKKGIAAGFSVLFLVALFFGVWGAIGWQLSRLGIWGITAAVAIFVVQVTLLFRAIERGLGMFFFSAGGIMIWLAWAQNGWVGVAITAAVLVVQLLVMRFFGSGAMLSKSMERRAEPSAVEGARATPQPLAINPEESSEVLLHSLASGRFRRTEVRRKPAREADAGESHPVDCTVFAPENMEKEQRGLLQVFLHAPEDRKTAEAAALKSDRRAEERGYRSLVLDTPIGTLFAFDVEIEDFELKRSTETLLWTGRPQAATFRFVVPKRGKFGEHTGTVFVSKNGTPVGSISFQIGVVRQATQSSPFPAGKDARHYHSCFCSYSTLDRAEMLKREQGLRAAGLETFVDAVNLRPGEIWSPKIFEAIDESDLFVLVWSKNACASKWVRKEASYALKRYKRHRRPDFRPIPVEGPPIAPVPRSLRAFNFNDDRLFLIRAAELEAAEREKQKAEEKTL